MPNDGPYPAFLLAFWQNGILEFGDLQIPPLRFGDERDFTIPATGVLWYMHDALALFHGVYECLGYAGEVEVEIRMDNIAGYALGIERELEFRTIELAVAARGHRIPEENDPVVFVNELRPRNSSTKRYP